MKPKIPDLNLNLAGLNMNNSISKQQYNQVDSEEDDSDSLDDLNVNDSVHSRPEKLHG